MSIKLLTFINIVLLGIYGWWPSRFSWYALLLPLIFTITYYMVGHGTFAARQMVIFGNAALAAYFIYNGLSAGYGLSILSILAYSLLRMVKFERRAAAGADTGRYLQLELAIYTLMALAGLIIGLDNRDEIVWAGVIILIAHELTERDLLVWLTDLRKSSPTES